MYSTQSSVTMQTVNAVHTFVDWCCFAVRLVIKSYALVFEAFLMSSASVTFIFTVREFLVTRYALVTRSDFTQTQPPRDFTHHVTSHKHTSQPPRDFTHHMTSHKHTSTTWLHTNTPHNWHTQLCKSCCRITTAASVLINHGSLTLAAFFNNNKAVISSRSSCVPLSRQPKIKNAPLVCLFKMLLILRAVWFTKSTPADEENTVKIKTLKPSVFTVDNHSSKLFTLS